MEGIDILALIRRVPQARARLFSLVASAFFLGLHSVKFEASARFRGDTWEYQSLAVNLVKGCGFPKFGLLVPFAEYGFEDSATQTSHYGRFAEAGKGGGEDHFYRNPGYPWFLAVVYSFVGVRPLAAKLLQAVLMFIVAAGLMRIGRLLWGQDGFYAGALAGPLYVGVYGYQAGHILTEPLIAFSMAALVESFLRWHREPSLRGAAVLGACFALSLYVKSSNVFIPPFVALLLWWRTWGTPATRRLAHSAAALGTRGVLLAPYAVFATARTGSLVILSTQGPTSLLDNNNEFSLASGAWGPQWRNDPRAFYNLPEIAPLPPLRKVAAFYASRPSDFFRAASYKLNAGFRDAIFLKFVWSALVAEALVRVWWRATRRRRGPGAARAPAALVGTVGAIFCASAVEILGVLPLAAGAAASFLWTPRGLVTAQVSGIFGALLANFVLIFVVFDGAPRFFSVVQPFFILLSFRVAFATIFDPVGWTRCLAPENA